MKKNIKLRDYHAHVWNEPIIMEMSYPGQRGIMIPLSEENLKNKISNIKGPLLPSNMERKDLPNLPEIAQPQVIRHYERLSQQTLGMEQNIDIGQGTCTMKYSPKINEQLASKIQEMHPDQPVDTIQGVLEIIYRLDLYLREISGMDQFTFQPGGGSHATFANACIMREYHRKNGELDQRNEVITTMFSHPCDTSAPMTAGFKVITLMPDVNGYPDLEALRAVCSKHTAGLMITNPEDTGIYNPKIDEFVKIVHDVGGLCFYDQANLNGVIGIARAREAGFDACHFNLHKTFSSPHGCMGPGCGAYGCVSKLVPFLPKPIVSYDEEKYYLEYDNLNNSIGKIREFYGNIEVLIKSLAWILNMGPEGLVEAAKISVLNNNYLSKLLLSIPGVVRYYAEGRIRLDQERFSWEKLTEDTGIGTEEIRNRMVDYGIQAYHTSHHPYIVPEPFTPEPCETYSKEDCDYWAAVMKQISQEAYTDPDIIRTAPHNSSIHKINSKNLEDPKKWAMTWRAYQKKWEKKIRE